MSDEPGRDPVRSSRDEPASANDPIVPAVDAWQRAADQGAATSQRAATGEAEAGDRGGRPGAPWTPASARLPDSLHDELIDWLRGGLPNEGCGVLVSERVAEEGGLPSRFVGMRNAAASPYRYLMDPEEQLRVLLDIDDRDEVVWGIVHSHVSSSPVPSSTDVGLAAYPDALYLIASFASEPPQLRAWTIVAGAVNEVILEPV